MARHDFPIYASHDAAYCFNCGGDWRGSAHPQHSGWPDGQGAWRQRCQKCGFDTWYDVQDDDDARALRAMQDDQDAEELF